MDRISEPSQEIAAQRETRTVNPGELASPHPGDQPDGAEGAEPTSDVLKRRLAPTRKNSKDFPDPEAVVLRINAIWPKFANAAAQKSPGEACAGSELGTAGLRRRTWPLRGCAFARLTGPRKGP